MGGNTAGLSLDFLPPSFGPKALHLRESWACPVPRLLRPSRLRGTGSCLPQGPLRQAGPAATCRRKAVGFI